MEDGSRDITARFVASVKKIFGQTEAALPTDEAPTVGGELRRLCSTSERERGLFVEADVARSDVIVLLNGRNIVFLEGLRTSLASGDVISVFPPLIGG